MKPARYSLLAITNDEQLCADVCTAIENNRNYILRKMSLEAALSVSDVQPDDISAVIIFSELQALSVRTWIRRTIEKTGVPVIAVSRGKIDAQELAVSSKAFKTCTIGNSADTDEIVREINIKIRMVALPLAFEKTAEKAENVGAEPLLPEKPIFTNPRKLIAIGASMGGVEAVTTVLRALPEEMPGIVVTQHMPTGFTEMFAKSLNMLCSMNVVQACDKMRIEQGNIYIAPGGMQMSVSWADGKYIINVYDGDRVAGHKPSVNVLFSSVAKAAGRNAMGIILTGMGSDGAAGLLLMRRAGAYTIGQDEATSVVYGMPKVAFETGAVVEQVPLEQVARRMLSFAAK